MNPQQVVTLLTILVSVGLWTAGWVVGWMGRAGEIRRLQAAMEREDGRWKAILLDAEEQRVGERRRAEEIFRAALESQRQWGTERAKLKYQLGTMRGQGKVGLLEDDSEEGWVLTDEHELEVQRERRRGEDGAQVDSTLVNYLLDV